jgi:hypothetical protein
MAELNEHYKKLGKITILPNFLVDEPYLTIDVVMEPRLFSSGEDGQYEVVVGFTEAHVTMDHPGYEANSHYTATIAPEIWSASVRDKASMDAVGSVEVEAGGGLFGWFRASSKGNASASKARTTEVTADTPYPLIQPTTDGWVIGGVHGDPRYNKNNVGEKAGLLQGSYFKGETGEISSSEKTHAGRPKNAKLQYRHGANSLKIAATLTAPKRALQVRIKRRHSATIPFEEAEERHAEKLREKLVELCVARELEMARASEEGLQLSQTSGDQVFLDRCEKMGQRPAKARR